MAKVKVSEWSATPGSNTDIDGINIAENCPPSGINDAIREMMSQIKDWQSGASGDSLTIGAAGSLTLSGGTANGIPFLNGSKVLTSGTALTFDGTNLGIGTSSPGYKLTVNGFTAVSGPQAAVKQTAEANAFSGIAVQRSTNDSTLGLAFNSIADAWQISASYASSGAYKPIQLLTGDTVRATLDSSGNLLVGTTSSSTSSAGVHVFNYAGTVGTSNFIKTGSGTFFAVQCIHSGSSVGGVQYSNTGTIFSTSSDYRLKENIAPMTGALAKVAALKPVTYKWKANGSDSQGFIAHELQAVVPECVTGEKDAVDAEGKPVYQGIDTSFLVATLTAALQEQQAIIQSMEARLAALEAK